VLAEMPLLTHPTPFAQSPHAPAEPGAVLSRAALQQYAANGYVAIPDLCSAADLAQIRATLLGFFRRRVGRDEGSQFDMLGLDSDASAARQPQILKPSVFAPALLRTEYFYTLERAARQLLGPDARLSFDHSILKPAHSAAATPWHQDEAHHSSKYLRYRQVSFWMPLQDTPVEAGCMRYIPGSHHGPLLPHRWLNDDPRIHAIEVRADSFDESLAVAIPSTAGSCIAHDGRTVHSALPNVSSVDRFAYIVVFAPPPKLARRERAVALKSSDTAHMRRHARWLRRGGFLVYAIRRLRQGLRSSPGALWLKARLLMRVVRVRAPTGR
jgi:ectoine hydroxylase-related dioxygenase (phytanoyl-CoA dioxygenase family)